MKRLILLTLALFLVMVGIASAALSITETSVSLGTAGVGTTASGTFTLSNSAAATVSLTYTDISFSGSAGPFTGAVSATTPATILASSSTTVNLKVVIPAAQAVGTYTGTLLVKDSANSNTNASLPVTVTVSNTHDVIVEGGEIVVDLDYGVLRDDDANITVSKAFTVKNTGAFSETVTLALSNLNAAVKNSALTDTTFTLAAGASKSVTFSAAMPVTFDAGVSTLPSFGKLRISFNSNTQTKDVDMKANAKTMLDIVKLEADVGDERDSSVDDGEKISKDASRSDKIVLTFEVKNLFDDNYDEGGIDNVEVNVQIDESDEDEFDESVDEDSTDFDVNAGDREKDVTVEFDVPDDAEDGTYTFLVTATGEDGNGAEHTAKMTFDLEVKIERDDVRITRIDLTPTTVECSRDVLMSVQVKNHGSRDQDDVSLQIDSAALGIDEDFKFELEESGGDDDARRQFSFTVGDNVAAAIYPIEVRVFIDGDELQDSEHVNLNVRSCAATVAGSAGSAADNGSTTGSTTVVIQPGAGTSDTAGSQPDTTLTGGAVTDIVFDSEEAPFTQSPLFWVVLALANVVVLGVIVFVLVKVLK